MTAIIVIVVILLLIIATPSNKKSKRSKNSIQRNPPAKSSVSNSSTKPETTKIELADKDEMIKQVLSGIQIRATTSFEKDDSIIDVTGQSVAIKNENASANYVIQPYSYDPDAYKLGKVYKDKLQLSNQEVSWLNKFWNPSNVFLSIEGCCKATIQLYLATLKNLDKQLKAKGTTLGKEVSSFNEEYKKAHDQNGWYYYDNAYIKERAEADFYLTIFKRAEKAVREAYGHKRGISGDFPNNSATLSQIYEDRIGAAVNEIIALLLPTIGQPDASTDAELNTQNVTRWKTSFEKLTNSFQKENKEAFIEGIKLLEAQNQKNSSIENIFFEASKFIAKHDKVEALKFYIYYLYYDLKSDRFDQKQLTKTIQKSLFSTNEQLNDFERIISELIKTKDLNSALTQVQTLYEPKRKKIQLNTSAIQEVQAQDKDAVALLNEYLQDEFDGEEANIKIEEINAEEAQIEITSKTHTEVKSPFVDGIVLNQHQASLVGMFSKESFTIAQHSIEDYCKSNGLFKNQLIDSINEACYEVLDDVLIEEEGDMYTVNQAYYQKITAQ